MYRLRLLCARRPGWMVAIFAAALALRVLVPAGYMPVRDHGRIVITICTGAGPATMQMTMPGMTHHGGEGGAVESPCAFADLALPLLGGVDPVQLAAAIAFAFVTALLLATTAPVVSPGRLRPPLRAPPIL